MLLHGSAPNTSTRRRAGMTLRYCAADVRYSTAGSTGRKLPSTSQTATPTGFWNDWRRPEDHIPSEWPPSGRLRRHPPTMRREQTAIKQTFAQWSFSIDRDDDAAQRDRLHAAATIGPGDIGMRPRSLSGADADTDVQGNDPGRPRHPGRAPFPRPSQSR